MFDIASTELLLVALVALVVIGPKDLPRLMRTVGHWMGKVRGMAQHFRSGMDDMIRQSELDDLNRKWAAENERIMRENPMTSAQAADVAATTGDDVQATADPASTPQPPLTDAPPPTGKPGDTTA
jgi:sec-independent protein translocase protein TatB